MSTGMLNGNAQLQSTLCQGFSGVTAAINNNEHNISAQLSAIAANQANCCWIFMAA